MKNSNQIVVAIGLLLACGSAHSATWEVYDEFNQGAIVSDELWEATSYGYSSGVQYMNKRVDSGQLRLGLRAVRLRGTSEEGPQSFKRNRVLVNPGISTEVNGVEADVTVERLASRGCSTPGSELSKAAFTLQNVFFNTGLSTGAGDFSGEVFSAVEVRKGDEDSGPVAVAFVTVCNDAACGDSTVVYEEVLMPVELNNPIKLNQRINEVRGVLKYSASQGANTAKSSYDFSNELTVGGSSPNSLRANVQARAVVAECEASDAKRPYAEVEATVDRVMLRR